MDRSDGIPILLSAPAVLPSASACSPRAKSKRVILRSEFPKRCRVIAGEETRALQFSTASIQISFMMGLMPSNVLGGSLQCCCTDPVTGFYRDGYCRTGAGDLGLHTVCAVMTSEFLEFSAARGNDLINPRPEMGFTGLGEGDRWCFA